MYVVTFTDAYGVKCVRAFHEKSRCQLWLNAFSGDTFNFVDINVHRVHPDNGCNWGSSQLINPRIELEVVTTEKKVWNL